MTGMIRLHATLWSAAKLWLLLVALFSIGRGFYLVAYLDVLQLDPWTVAELVQVLSSAIRFDSATSVVLILPVLLVGPAQRPRPTAVVAALVSALAWLLVVVDHYFYVFFKDHLNVFFWEFLENASNAWLVAGGAGDEVPLVRAVIVAILGMALAAFLAIKVILRFPLPSRLTPRSRRTAILGLVAWLLALALAGRGTLQQQPLLIQDRRTTISANRMLALLHTNPFFPLVRSWRDHAELRAGRGRAAMLDPRVLPTVFARAAALVPGTTPKRADAGYWYLASEIEPVGDKILKRKPRHVVLIFMESYSSWVMDHPDRAFSERLSATMLRLSREGLFFAHHFPSHGGTIKNLASAIYSLALPREFAPSLNYHAEAYKPFPSTMPRLAKALGYSPRFFYAGHGPWHRLYQFIPQIGFDEFYAENNFPTLPKHEYGLLDGDLFEGVHEHLTTATAETFNVVMTLTNHPPFLPPAPFNDRSWEIPESVRERSIVEVDQLYDRLNSFRYADRALGAFLERALAAPYGKDTLFVITGDHPFGGSLVYPLAYGWKEEGIPLVFYAPQLFTKAWQGRRSNTFSTHLDLVPTITALLTDRSRELHSWGKNLFTAPVASQTGINFYFSCLDGLCLKNGQLLRADENNDLKAVPKSKEADRAAAEIRAREEALYGSGLHYLKEFR